MHVRQSSVSALGVLLCALSSATALNAGSASGTLTVNGTEFTLVQGYATTRPHPFDDTKTTALLVFADRSLPGGSSFEDSDIAGWSRKGFSGVTIQIDEEGDAISGSLFSPRFRKMKHFSTTGNQKVEITSRSSDRIAGNISVPADSMFDEKFAYDVSFDLSIEGAPGGESVAGERLPPGGGDPGNAYGEFRKVVFAGDLQGIRKLVGAEMAEQTNSPEFEEMLPMIRDMQPKSVRITGGTVKGDTATLDVESLDQKNTTALVTMQREQGQWKVVNEAWRTRSAE